jgi:hypothetical protein
MRSWVPTVEGFEVSGFVSRGILVDAGEVPQSLVAVLQVVVEGSISTLRAGQRASQNRDILARLLGASRRGAVDASSTRFLPLFLAR